jgi:hypothetical protein
MTPGAPFGRPGTGLAAIAADKVLDGDAFLRSLRRELLRRGNQSAERTFACVECHWGGC